jgi:hypothetical protein
MAIEEPAAGTVALPRMCRDRSADWLAYYHSVRVNEVAGLLTDAVIDEHGANPTGYRAPHSPRLQRVLNYMRTQPALGKHFIYTEQAWSDYRIATIGGRGETLRLVGDASYSSEEEAMHAVFLIRVAAIRAAASNGGAL